MNREMQLKQFYSNEWQNVLNQMNVENALAEEVRQANIQQAQWEKEYQQKIAEFEEQKRQFDVEIARLKAKDEEEARYKAQQLELQKQQLAEEQRQFNLQYQQSKISGGGSGGSYRTSGSSVHTTSGGSYSLHGGQGSSGANASANKTSSSGWHPIYSVGGGGAFGNSQSTKKKKDYYFDNGYQPRYIDNTKLKASGYTVGDLSDEVIKGLGVPTSQKVWEANGRYYVWIGKTKEYAYISKK
jgi:hypothetical protein